MNTTIPLTIHDLTDFPLVRLRPAAAVPGYAAAWCGEMHGLLATEKQFVLIYPPAAQQEDHEDRKLRGLWLKQNKEALAALCLGLIIVEPDSNRRIALEAQMAGTARAFGTPQATVESVAEAEALARRLLAGETLPAVG
ncbi:GntR family transcriptional regulator [Nitrospirillum amazonense]|uniref:GntR family transcriptional regulator n=1 Tax=Nitrospirillum amazonense TaxID=28077 RepID=UPI001FEA1278|nr:GntR family transcriptional regulator [Nitrospirillum amazonense]